MISRCEWCVFAGVEIGLTGVNMKWSLPVVLRNWNKLYRCKQQLCARDGISSLRVCGSFGNIALSNRSNVTLTDGKKVEHSFTGWVYGLVLYNLLVPADYE